MSFLNTLKNFMTSKDSIENAKKQGELGWSLYIENSSQLNEKIENLLTKSAARVYHLIALFISTGKPIPA